MGYRSDVAITILFETLDAAKLFTAKVRAAQPETVRDALTEYGVHVHEDGVTVLHGHYESVKWYPNYEDVAAHHKLIELAEEAGAGWRFIRVGEDPDDGEDSYHDPGHGDGWCDRHIWDDSQLVRSVCINLPTTSSQGKELNAHDLPEWVPEGTTTSGDPQ